MPGYSVETVTHRIGANDYHVRALLDRQQFWDPDGCAERAGISSAAWPLFGVVWPSGIALAQEINDLAVDGMSILEIGCGIGLSSLVLQRRGANITASDYHPLAEEFLRHNAALNGLAPIKFSNAPWAGPNHDLGRFDLIIGSDILYERNHPALLAAFLDCHANTVARVLMTDPGRRYCGHFNTQMSAQGYVRTERRMQFTGSDSPYPKGRIMSFARP
jgi:predicted nicotinamide N-methyase